MLEVIQRQQQGLREALCTLGNPAKGGAAITDGMNAARKKLGGRTVHACVVIDLLRADGRVVGALGYRIIQRRFVRIMAKTTILACGGSGELFERNYTVSTTTGDGYALAARAGAPLMDMEFVQFHPAMGLSPLRTILPTTLFGDGALLRNRMGDTFLEHTVAGGEKNAGRDEMSRAIFAELRAGRGKGGGVFLDLTRIPEALVRGHQEPIAERLLRHSLKEHWDSRLVLRYGLLSVDAARQLVYAEKWLQERPNDPDLLLTLGRLSLRNAYWAKAQEYFEASQRQRPSGVVCAELARLYANLGEHNKSQLYYRQSVELLDKSLPSLPQPSEPDESGKSRAKAKEGGSQA